MIGRGGTLKRRRRMISRVSSDGRTEVTVPTSLPPDLSPEGKRAHLRATLSLLRVPVGSF